MPSSSFALPCLLLVLAAGAVACSDDAPSPATSDTSPADALADATEDATTDAGADVAEPLDATQTAPPAKATLLLSGGIHLLPGPVSRVMFFNAMGMAGDRCTFQKVGECVILDCRPNLLPAQLALADAGTVSVGTEANPLLVGPGPGHAYPFASSQGALWTAGDKLTFTATGGADIPAFATTLTLPALPESVNYGTVQAGMVVVDRSQDYTVTWKPRQGEMALLIVQTPVGVEDWMSDVHVGCSFDAAAGQGTVPPSVLQVFLASNAETKSGISLVAQATTTLEQGNWPLRVMAFNGSARTANFK